MVKKDNTIRKLYSISLLSSNYIAPIYVVYLLDKGLGFSQIALLHIAKDITGFIFEIPSGIFADITNRKYSLALSAFLFLLSMFFFILGSEFIFLLFAFIFWGASFSFISGTDSAIAYDNAEDQAHFSRIISNMGLFRKISSFITKIIGPVIYSLYSVIPFIASGLNSLLQMLLSLTLKKDKKRTQKITVSDYLSRIKQAILIPNVFITMGIYAVLTSAITSLFVYQQPKLLECRISVKFFSIVYAVIFLFNIISSYFVRMIKKSTVPKLYSIILITTMSLSIYFLSKSNNSILIVLLMTFQSVMLTIITHLKTLQLNSLFSNHNRSGLLSIQSLIGNVVQSILIYISGILAERHGIEAGFVFLSLIPLLVLPIILFNKKDSLNQK